MAAKRKLWPWILGGLGTGLAGLLIKNRLTTVTAQDGPGSDVIQGPSSSTSQGVMLSACKPYGSVCDPNQPNNGGCCFSRKTSAGTIRSMECLADPKSGKPPYKCRDAKIQTKAKVLGEGSVGAGYKPTADIKVTVKEPRYLITWYDQNGHGAVSDLSLYEADDLITGVVAMGGGETDIPRCTKYPDTEFVLYPMNDSQYPPGMFSDLLNALNHKNTDWLREHAFKYAMVEGGAASKSVMFKDLWPGSYWLYNLSGLGKGVSTVKIGVENFESGLGNILGNMYNTLKSYLGGNMDWSQITVLRSCKRYPSYLRVSPGGARMLITKAYTYQPYFHYSFHEGNVSGTFEWLEDAFNDMGEYISDKVDEEFGEDFGW